VGASPGNRGVVPAVDMAPDGQHVLAGQFDAHILAFGAGDLSVKFVCFLGLADVEARPGTAAVAPVAAPGLLFLVALYLARIRVEVFEEAEERGEVGVGGV